MTPTTMPTDCFSSSTRSTRSVRISDVGAIRGAADCTSMAWMTTRLVAEKSSMTFIVPLVFDRLCLAVRTTENGSQFCRLSFFNKINLNCRILLSSIKLAGLRPRNSVQQRRRCYCRKRSLHRKTNAAIYNSRFDTLHFACGGRGAKALKEIPSTVVLPANTEKKKYFETWSYSGSREKSSQSRKFFGSAAIEPSPAALADWFFSSVKVERMISRLFW